MSRARNIKPGFFKNDVLAECDPLARILFAGLWCEADREGRLEDRPKRLKAEYLCYDDCDVDALLDQLSNGGFILRYAVGNCKYIQVLEFKKHQNPHVKEAASTIPAPGEHSASTVQAGLIPDSPSLIPDSKEKPARGARDPRKVEIQTWLKALPDGEIAIPEDDPIFDYAEKVGIPLEFLELSWRRFVEDMTDRHVRKIDWRAHYRNAVKGNWLKIWWFTPTGECQLTTVGQQAARSAAA